MKQAIHYILLAILLCINCNATPKNTASNAKNANNTSIQPSNNQTLYSAYTTENSYNSTIVTYHFAEKKFDSEYETIVIRYFDILLPQSIKSHVKDSIFSAFFNGVPCCERYANSLRILDTSKETTHNYCDFSSYWESTDHFYFSRCGKPIWITRDFMCYSANLDSYIGGAHGYWSNLYYVFDLKTGKSLTSNDIFDETKTTKLSTLIRHRIFKNADEDNCLWEDFEPHIENVRFEPQSITFVYIPYEAACYSQGHVEASFSVDEILPYLNKDCVIYKYFMEKGY